MTNNKNELPEWLSLLLGIIGLVTISLVIGGPAIFFFSLAWPLVLLLVVWGLLGWAWEALRDHVYWKKHDSIRTKPIQEKRIDHIENGVNAFSDAALDDPFCDSLFFTGSDEEYESHKSEFEDTNAQWQEFTGSLERTSPTIGDLAKVVGVSVEVLLDQIKESGLPQCQASDRITNDDKNTLLAFLRNSKNHKKIKLRKKPKKPKRIYVKRDPD